MMKDTSTADLNWIGDAVEALRELYTLGDVITLEDGLPVALGISLGTQEARLRKMTNLGVLRMEAVWMGGDFSHYAWSLRTSA